LFLFCFDEVGIFVGSRKLDLFFFLLNLFLIALLVFLGHQLFDDPGESEIAYFDDKSLSVDEDVGGFEVPVNDVGGVKVLEAAEDLVEDEADIIEFEEDVVAFEHFLEVTVAELSDDVDLVEVVQGLALGDENLDEANDIGVLAVFEKDDLAEDAAGLGEGLEEVDDLLDGHIRVVALADCLGHVAIGALADDFLYFVALVEVRRWENVVDGIADGLALRRLIPRLHDN
jgi:hypothetical protein